jgi:hypothetical protein
MVYNVVVCSFHKTYLVTRHIAYFTRMEINVKKYEIIPLCDGIVKDIDAELSSD